MTIEAREIHIETPLAQALRSNRRINEQVRTLSRLRPARTLVALALDWFIIAAAIFVGVRAGAAWFWLPCAIVIASRQHALAILMHEGAHHRIITNRSWNDRISNWLAGYTILITTEGYRKSHIAHHNYLNTEKDPDWMRKRGRRDWTFPKRSRDFFLLLLKVCFGAGALHLGGRAKAYGSQTDSTRNPEEKLRKSAWERLFYYLLWAVVLTLSHGWTTFLLYWMIPLFTLLPILLRIRSIAEHFGMEWTEELTMSRSTEASLWERFLLAPHAIHYHLEHHLFPSVPFYNVPALRRALMEVPEFASRAHVSKTYFGFTPTSFFRDITGRRHERP